MARMRKQALLGWKQPCHKCAQSCLHKKNARIVWATTEKITQKGQELTENENEQRQTYIAMGSMKK